MSGQEGQIERMPFLPEKDRSNATNLSLDHNIISTLKRQNAIIARFRPEPFPSCQSVLNIYP